MSNHMNRAHQFQDAQSISDLMKAAAMGFVKNCYLEGVGALCTVAGWIFANAKSSLNLIMMELTGSVCIPWLIGMSCPCLCVCGGSSFDILTDQTEVCWLKHLMEQTDLACCESASILNKANIWPDCYVKTQFSTWINNSCVITTITIIFGLEHKFYDSLSACSSLPIKA